jgi:hypothetical protein
MRTKSDDSGRKYCGKIPGFVLLLLLITLQSKLSATTGPSDLQSRLLTLEVFLAAQFNGTVGLVRESPDKPFTSDYWLLSDNLIATHVLAVDYPNITARINQTMQKYRIFTDGLHEALFGAVIQFPLYTPTVKIVENDSSLVQVEVRSIETGKFQPDWVRYADLLCYGALSAYNSGDYTLANYYFNQALQMWNGAGLWDSPTQQDGFYSVYKLALLMYTADKLNQTIPYRAQLEARIWQFQREDGGIRAFYLGNMTSNREANSETAGLVLLAYQYNAWRTAQQEVTEQALNRQAAERQQTILAAFAVIVLVVVTAVFLVRRKRRKHSVERSDAGSGVTH